jgi:uncharacterized protein involved in exopolysaccharide biosynthesis
MPIRRRRWKLWILAPTLLGAVIGAGVSAQTKPLYKSDTLVLVVPQRVPENYVRSTITMKIGDRLQAISQQILSRTRLERIIQDFDLYKQERRTGLMEDVVDAMRKHIEVKVEGGDAFRVGFIGTDPRTVMKVAERLAALFIDESLRDREVLADSTNQFLESQLEDVRQRLTKESKELRARPKGDPQAETLAIEHEVLQATFKDLFAKIEESRVAANLERRQIGEQFKLLDPARVAERPFAPDWRQYVGIGAGAGLTLGAFALLLIPSKSSRKRGETPEGEASAADVSPSEVAAS